MTDRRNCRRSFLRIVLTVAVTLAFAGLIGGEDVIIYTLGVKMRVTQVRASKAGGSTVKAGEGVTDTMKSALIRVYGLKYKTYTLLDDDTRLVQFNEHQVYDLPGGKQMDVVIESHRQAIVNVKIQIGMDIQMVRMIHLRHWLLHHGEDPEPLIVIFTPEVMQTTRKP